MKKIKTTNLPAAFRLKQSVLGIRSLSRPAMLWPLLLVSAVPFVHAAEVGGQTGARVVAGNVGISRAGNTLTLNQASQAAIVNWEKFNIAPNELVRVMQTSPAAAMLARVTGGDPSQLQGQLKADGKFFLINPRGVVIGAGALIDTAAFMATTLDLADADFLKQGALTFKGDSSAGVVNLGRIVAREGNVMLVAHTVQNAGDIAAGKGLAGLAAGTELYLASPDAPGFVIKANLARAAGSTGVDNSGVIAAAQAELKAAGGSIYDLAVNQSGRVQATGFASQGGRIVLTAEGGNVALSGQATARRADGAGGEILVGGDFQGKNSSIANATRTYVGESARLDANAASAMGDGGRVIVWADKDTQFLGAIAATGGQKGGNGGFAEVSGKRNLSFAGQVDLGAAAGKTGQLLLDPTDLTIVAGTTAAPLPGSLDALRKWFAAEDAGPQTLGATTLANLLTGGSVTLQASNSLTVNSAVTPASGAASTQLTLTAPTLAINAPISLANISNGQLYLTAGAGGNNLSASAAGSLNAAKVIAENFPIVSLGGAVTTSELLYNNNAGNAVSLSATNASNAVTRLNINTDQAAPAAVNFSGAVSVASGGSMDVSALIGGSTATTLTAAGSLTLLGANGIAATSSITSSGTITLAATGGAMTNQAGASALAGSGRRRIYSNSGVALGGLTGYTQVAGVSYPNDPNSGSQFVLYIAPAGGGSPPAMGNLTITANDAIRLYGQADPSFSASFSGGTEADLTRYPSFSIAGGLALNVGVYAIVPYGASSSTHNISYVNGSLRVDPAVLTYVAVPASRAYGDNNPLFSGTVTGFVNGDTLANMTSGTLVFSSPTSSTTNAGTWAILGSGLQARSNNYVFADAVANYDALTISKAPLTVTFGNAERSYGVANPVFTPSFSGFRNGETPAVFTSTGQGSSATISSPVGEYVIGGSFQAQNYAVNLVPGTLKITPAPLTISFSNFERFYGVANPVFTPVYSGFRLGETTAVVTGSSIGSSTNASSPVGDYLIGGNFKAPNYAINLLPGTLRITPVPLTLSAGSATAVYGERFTIGYTVTGMVNGDPASVLAGVIPDDTGDGRKPVGSYDYGFASTGSARNYVVTKVVPGKLTVTPAPLTLSGAKVTSVYGDTPLLSYTVTGMKNGEAPSILSGVKIDDAGAATVNAGNYIYGFSSTGSAQNYVVTSVVPGTLSVTKAPLTLVARSASALYGLGLSAGGFDIIGLRNGDTASVLRGVELAGDTLPATTYAGVYPVTFQSAGTASNYSISTKPGSLTISPRILTYSAPTYDIVEGAIPQILSPAQQALISGGPHFHIVGTVPSGTDKLPVGSEAVVSLSVVPDDGALMADILHNYNFVFNPGALKVKYPKSAFFMGDPSLTREQLTMKESVYITLDKFEIILATQAELDAQLAAERKRQGLDISVRMNIDGVKHLYETDFAQLIADDKSWFAQQIIDSIYRPYINAKNTSSIGYELSPETLRLLEAFARGDESAWAALVARYMSDSGLRAAMTPLFGAYVGTLIKAKDPITETQQLVLDSLGARVKNLRTEIVESAEKKYADYQREENARREAEGLNALVLGAKGLFGKPTDWSLKENNIAQDAYDEVMAHQLAAGASLLAGLGVGSLVMNDTVNMIFNGTKALKNSTAFARERIVASLVDDIATQYLEFTPEEQNWIINKAIKEAGTKTSSTEAKKITQAAIDEAKKMGPDALKKAAAELTEDVGKVAANAINKTSKAVKIFRGAIASTVVGVALDAVIEIGFVIADHVVGEENLKKYNQQKDLAKNTSGDLRKVFGNPQSLSDTEVTELTTVLLGALSETSVFWRPKSQIMGN